MGVAMFPLFVFPFLVILCVAAFVLLRFIARRIADGRGTGLVVAAVIGAGVVALFLLVFLVKATAPRAVSVQRAVISHGHGEHVGSTTAQVWTPALENEYGWQADVHASIRSAADALGRKIGTALARAATAKDRPVLLYDETASAGLGASIGGVIAEISGRGVITEPPESEGAPKPLRLAIRLTKEPTHRAAPWNSRLKLVGGTLQAVVDDSEVQLVETTRYIDKPWVEQFAAFVNRQTSQRYLLAQSEAAQTNQAAAAHDARREAARQLLEEIGLTANPSTSHLPHEVKVGMIAARLANRPEVVDTFTQTLEGRHGRVWRHAILVAPNDRLLHDLERDFLVTVASARSRQIVPWAGVIAMFLVVLLMYGVVNAATRGYYTWVLRGIAILAVVVAIAVAGVGLLGFA